LSLVSPLLSQTETYIYAYGNNSRRITSELNVACKGETKNAHSVFVGKPEGQKKLEIVAVDGRIIFKKLLNKWDWRAWVWPRIRHNCGVL